VPLTQQRHAKVEAFTQHLSEDDAWEGVGVVNDAQFTRLLIVQCACRCIGGVPRLPVVLACLAPDNSRRSCCRSLFPLDEPL
jgi:hypothetical protein